MQKLRTISLKTIGMIVTAALSIASFQSAHAAQFNVTGRVNNLFVGDLATYGANANNFTLVGVGSAGACATFLGFVVFRIKDDARGQQMFAQILAAANSGGTLTVGVDDAIRDATGACFVTGLVTTGS